MYVCSLEELSWTKHIFKKMNERCEWKILWMYLIKIYFYFCVNWALENMKYHVCLLFRFLTWFNASNNIFELGSKIEFTFCLLTYVNGVWITANQVQMNYNLTSQISYIFNKLKQGRKVIKVINWSLCPTLINIKGGKNKIYSIIVLHQCMKWSQWIETTKISLHQII